MSESMPSARALIAVVDDDEAVRDGLSSLLRALGFAVDVFQSAEEFLLSERLDGTTCLIADVRMPGMSGIELQRRLLAADSRLPIVFITAHADRDAERRALALGAVAFLRKPCREDVLVASVEAAISRSGGAPVPT